MVKLTDEQIRDIAALREKMQKRLMQLQEDLEETNLCITAIDMALKRSSFTKASEYVPAESAADEEPPQTAAAREPAESEPEAPREEAGPAPRPIIASATDAQIGTIVVHPDRIVVTLEDGVPLSPATPPFQTFFVERILGEMQRKDAAAADAGEIPRESIISYSLDTSDELLKGITIANYRTEDRVREIDSTVRWVLNRMLEHGS